MNLWLLHVCGQVQAIEDRVGQLQLRPTDEEDALKLLSKTTKAWHLNCFRN